MPPLPNTINQETLALVSSAHRHAKDISDFQIPRLRACKGPLSLQQTLWAEMRDDLDTFARQVEALDLLVDDQRGETNRRELRRTVDNFGEMLASLRKDSRAALLASKRTIDSQRQSQRAELLASSVVQEKQGSEEKVTDDALMQANDNVTEALRRTIGLMQGELERSVLTTQMLDESTATLKSTSATHDTLTNLMGTSKQLITALEKSDWIDRLLILFGLFVFSMVVLFILKQRILDRGIRVALWWTKFIPDFSGDEELIRMEKGGSIFSSVTVAVSSVVAPAATTLVASSSTMSSSDVATPTADDVQESPLLSSVVSPSLPSFTPVDSERTADTAHHDEL